MLQLCGQLEFLELAPYKATTQTWFLLASLVQAWV
jgi:hypothetical protein